MNNLKIAAGFVHELPSDLRRALASNRGARKIWEDSTPLARNEWICWVEDAKKPGTRRRRIERVTKELMQGKRRPCCWPGCTHRPKRGA